MLNLHDINRNKLLNYFNETWDYTELLFSAFKEPNFLNQTPYHNLRHPLIFYYCHPTVFYINKFLISGILETGIHAKFERIFEIGVDEMSWDDITKNNKPWPNITKIKDYREKAFEKISQTILKHKVFSKSKIAPKDKAFALLMSLEHERIHFETSSVLMREMPINLFTNPKNWPKLFAIKSENNNPQKKINFPENKMIFIPSQNIHLGKKTNDPIYGWDNEYGKRKIKVNPFYASQFLISNGEFLEFINNNCYNEKRFWSEIGWAWKNFRNVAYPTFWLNHENKNSNIIDSNSLNKYYLRTLFEIIPMQWDWPVIVNYHESKAFCNWLSEKNKLSYRLPFESEHHCIRNGNELEQNIDNLDENKRNLNQNEKNLDQNEMNFKKQANLNFQFGSETPVNAFSPNEKGFYDVFGNVWQWCEDQFSPLPGFKVHPYYIDFSTPFFDRSHLILMGSSFITTGASLSRHYRNFFRPHFFQHAGFRIVQNI